MANVPPVNYCSPPEEVRAFFRMVEHAYLRWMPKSGKLAAPAEAPITSYTRTVKYADANSKTGKH
jgi:hypothetical protein